MLKNQSLRVRLPLIILLTCILALFLAGIAFISKERRDDKLRFINEMSILSKVIASRSTAALIFDDPNLASENLAVLAIHGQIDKACIYKGQDQVFATYSWNGSAIKYPLRVETNYSYQFERDYFHIYQPIELEGERLGYVYIGVPLKQYKAEQRRQLFISFLILAIAAISAYLFSYRLLRGISKPLADLAQMAERVALNDDYSIRAKSSDRQDEIGSLIMAFNYMLSQIQSRDSALKDSENRFRSLLEQAADAFFLVDTEGNVVDVNHRACLSLGYSRQELLNMQVKDIDVTADAEQHKAKIWDKLSPGRPVTFEGVHCRKDGTTFPVEVHLGMLILEEKTYLSSLVRNISERKESEDELNRLRSLLKNIIDSMPSILISIDNVGFVTQWNQEAINRTGISAQKALGQSLANVFPELVDEMDQIKQAIKNKEVFDGKRISTHVDDELYLEDVTIYPLVANGVDGAVIRVDNVTAKVRIEEMMIQTEKMMSVGGLAAGMAHEINNPLGVMMHASQNIQRRFSQDLPANVKVAEKLGLDMADLAAYIEERRISETIKEIREACERAAKIVANMLQFSRKSESLHQSSDLVDLIDKTIDLAGNDYDLKKKFDFRQIEIVREYQADLPPVPVITTEFEQVILNILKNGAQAMAEREEPGHSRFIIRLMRDKAMVRIEIQDNGPGIPESIAKRIFEPFFTTKPVGLGTGLGLSVSFMIITNNHNGTMEAESTPGKGAKFIICLPLTR